MLQTRSLRVAQEMFLCRSDTNTLQQRMKLRNAGLRAKRYFPAVPAIQEYAQIPACGLRRWIASLKRLHDHHIPEIEHAHRDHRGASGAAVFSVEFALLGE